MKQYTSLLAVTCACLLSIPCQASLITWDAVQDLTAPSDVITSGALVSAVNGGASSTTIVGAGGLTVDFTAGAPLGGVATGLLAGGDTGNAPFNILLGQVSFGGGTGTTTVDLGAFTMGSTYQIQVFYTDQRVNSVDREMIIGSTTGGATVNMDPDPNNGTGTPFGSFLIGTFVADGVDPDLTFTPDGFGNSHISGYQVRNLGVIPEPSSFLLVGFGCVLLMARARR